MGTSGGVWGLERGYCLMIGGEADVVKRLDPIFKTLAPGRGDIPRTPGREKPGGTAEQGYLHCGPAGAGHFVKMVHNGIEYGLMAAYAEGLNILKHANIGKASRTRRTRRRRRCGTPSTTSTTSTSPTSPSCGGAAASIASWLLDLTAQALADDPEPRRRSAARCPTRARAAGRSRRPTTRACPPTCSPPRSSSASPRAARTTSRTRCSPRCASASAATSEKK